MTSTTKERAATTNTNARPDAIVMPASDLIPMLRFASYAMHEGESRDYLRGVRLDVDRAGLHVKATDGHRMHVTTLPGSWCDGIGWNALVKAADVRSILKTYATKAKQCGVYCRIDYAANTLSIGPSVYAFAIDYTLPDLMRVIPREPEPVVQLYADEVRPFIDAACAMLDRGVAFKIETAVKSNGVTLSATAYGRERSKTSLLGAIDCASVSKSHEAGFNARQVRDILNAYGKIRYGKLFVAQTESSHPSIWHAGDKLQFVVLMPMRV